MFAAFALALSALTAPPDPLVGLRYVCDDPMFIAVMHPAVLWDLPMAKPVRDHYAAAKVAVAAGKTQPDNPAADMDAMMAYGLARMCQSLDIDSPAEVERIAMAGGSETVLLVTLRRPLDQPAGRLGGPGSAGSDLLRRPEGRPRGRYFPFLPLLAPGGTR